MTRRLLWLTGAMASAWASRAAWVSPLAPDVPEPPPPLPRPVTAEERAALSSQTAAFQRILDAEARRLGHPPTAAAVEDLAPDNPLMPGAGGVTADCPPRPDASTDWDYCADSGQVLGATPQEL